MLKPSERFIPRDLSWLSFNYRVLIEAKDQDVPLFERIKFFSIFSSNLDEFYRVRVAHIRNLIKINKKKINKKLDFDPEGLLQRIHEIVSGQLEEYGEILRRQILPELAENGIVIYMGEGIEDEHRIHIDRYFKSRVLAFLNPVIIKKDNLVDCFLNNKALYFALRLSKKAGNNGDVHYAYLNIPSRELPRYHMLPKLNGRHYFISIDDVIRQNIEFIFPAYDILECASIKLNRDADLYIEDEYEGDLVEKIKNQISKRSLGVPSRFLFDKSMSEDLLSFLMKAFDLEEDDLVPGGRYHNMNDLMKVKNPLKPRLEGLEFKGIIKREFDRKDSIFDIIREKDYILHFPYHSYDYVLRFFNEAAIDPYVEAIKVTLYRIAANSFVAHALIVAAKNGKNVTVFVEVKARFDEENNLRWAKKMEEAGVKIIYSIPGLKVHAKVALVHRYKNDKRTCHAFLGTGNFNEVTAGIYCDLGLVTSHKEITEELDNVFEYLRKRKDGISFSHILVSQFNLQEKFLNLIDNEINNAKKGKEARIIIKLNNIQDQIMIDKLYEASQAGVQVDMIIRSVCSIIPGIEGLSENIRIIRLVDQFLEHARIIVFHNLGDEKIYIGSADWMPRNLYRRIEVVYPIYSREVSKEIKKVIDFQLRDNSKACILSSEHGNIPIEQRTDEKPIRAQLDTYKWLKEKEELAVETD